MRWYSILLIPGLIGVACGGEVPAENPPTWEEFRAASTRTFEGETFFVVEWDHAIHSEDELHAYYQRSITHADDTDEEIGRSERALMVNQVGDEDDLWSAAEVQELTYCVSTEFGATHARARTEMARATAAWASYANVRFSYDGDEDASCNNGNQDVSFSVRPWTNGGACAFFPSGGGCVARTLVIDYDSIDNDFEATAPEITTTGVLQHELGHVLGFRHEHIHPDSGNVTLSCTDGGDLDYRSVTSYDVGSVMHYPWCNGILTSDLALTLRDIEGSIRLYGMSVALLSTIL